MKEKIIGIVLLLIGIVAFIDTLHPLNLGLYHLRPYFFPLTCIGIGWLEIHGRAVPLQKKFSLPHMAAGVAVFAIAVSLFVYLHAK